MAEVRDFLIVVFIVDLMYLIYIGLNNFFRQAFQEYPMKLRCMSLMEMRGSVCSIEIIGISFFYVDDIKIGQQKDDSLG